METPKSGQPNRSAAVLGKFTIIAYLLLQKIHFPHHMRLG